MIQVYPDSFLSSALIIGIVLATVAVAALATLRWNWKAWLLVLLGGVVIPILVPALFMIVSYYVDVFNGEGGGFFFHAEQLILFVGLPSALIGFGGVLAARHIRATIR